MNLENIAAIWRCGCIIRASLLEDIRSVFLQQQAQHDDFGAHIYERNDWEGIIHTH